MVVVFVGLLSLLIQFEYFFVHVNMLEILVRNTDSETRWRLSACSKYLHELTYAVSCEYNARIMITDNIITPLDKFFYYACEQAPKDRLKAITIDKHETKLTVHYHCYQLFRKLRIYAWSSPLYACRWASREIIELMLRISGIKLNFRIYAACVATLILRGYDDLAGEFYQKVSIVTPYDRQWVVHTIAIACSVMNVRLIWFTEFNEQLEYEVTWALDILQGKEVPNNPHYGYSKIILFAAICNDDAERISYYSNDIPGTRLLNLAYSMHMRGLITLGSVNVLMQYRRK